MFCVVRVFIQDCTCSELRGGVRRVYAALRIDVKGFVRRECLQDILQVCAARFRRRCRSCGFRRFSGFRGCRHRCFGSSCRRCPGLLPDIGGSCFGYRSIRIRCRISFKFCHTSQKGIIEKGAELHSAPCVEMLWMEGPMEQGPARSSCRRYGRRSRPV